MKSFVYSISETETTATTQQLVGEILGVQHVQIVTWIYSEYSVGFWQVRATLFRVSTLGNRENVLTLCRNICAISPDDDFSWHLTKPSEHSDSL
jgi:hypothetical protein